MPWSTARARLYAVSSCYYWIYRELYNIKSKLLLISFVANLLVPIYSPATFEAIVNPSSLVSNLYSFVFFNLSEYGLALFQAFIFLLILFLSNKYFSNLSVKSNFPNSMVVIVNLIYLGILQFAQDLNSIQFFYIFSILYLLKDKTQSNYLYNSLNLILYGLFVFLDWRCIFIPFLNVVFIDFKKVRSAKFFLESSLAIILFCLNDYVKFSFFHSISYYEAILKSTCFSGALGQGFTFNFAFLMLLIILDFLVSSRGLNIRSLLFYTLILLVSNYSQMYMSYFALVLSHKILSSQIASDVKQINILHALDKLTKALSTLSSQGVIFFLLASIFVSLVSFLRMPITEQIYPLKEINKLVEERACPSVFSVELLGYLRYRFSHDSRCIESINQNISNIKMLPSSCSFDRDSQKLQIVNYSKLPDMWR